jgi:predicted ATP-grasp superfamily ATP-dependent carboligase
VTAARSPAVLLGGDANAVSVARSLSSIGVEVTALGEPDAQVRHSRSCHAFAAPGRDADGWLDWLRSEGPAGAVVLACSDEGLELVARNRAELVDLGYRPMEANDEAVLAMLDKHRTYVLARDAGVATPDFALPRTADDLAEAASRISFPCVLKPLRSHVFRTRFPGRGKLVVARDGAALRREWETLAGGGVDAIVSEIVPGPDSSIASLYTYVPDEGGPIFELVLRKLRQHPPGFGDGCYRISEWDPEVAELGRRFFAAAGVRGLAYVEFKRHADTSELVLIECNHRFGAANELVRLASGDPALLTYRRALALAVPATGPRRDGVRLWHPADDLRALLAYRRRGELSTAAWARSLLHRQHVPVFRWDDPLPTVAYHLRGAFRLARKAMRRR